MRFMVSKMIDSPVI